MKTKDELRDILAKSHAATCITADKISWAADGDDNLKKQLAKQYIEDLVSHFNLEDEIFIK